ncbi:hypothetical protein HMPREF0742_01443 [Rothia aeria F0184]|uniref:Uncharacterized protein n=1 Tax=Rothia aeria F0184 TaxID=888019 RepID=U7V5N7_9MICC|nr:hypothetical protein HMPREF0742_01443 [Rothia aeria F0184]
MPAIGCVPHPKHPCTTPHKHIFFCGFAPFPIAFQRLGCGALHSEG